MIITLNNIQITAHTDDAANYLASRIDPNDVLNFEEIASHNLWHLPIPEPWHPEPIIPNILKWPTNASRFATLFLLIDEVDLALLRSKFGLTGPVATTLFIDGEDTCEDLTVSMYMLPPRPLAPLAMMPGWEGNGLWLLPLVCPRYFWWFRSADITSLVSWTGLISAVATALGVTITPSAVSANYGTPTTRFQTYRQPLPLLIDAIAYTIGMRFVAKVDGTYLIQSYSDAKTVQDAQVALVDTRVRAPFAGGLFRIGEVKRSVPDTVAVVFPKTLDGNAQLAPYTASVTLATLALTEYIGNGSVTGATNASPIVITTGAAHGLSTGDLVTIASVGGNTAANGTWAITKISGTTFSLDMSAGNANYTSGGTWTNVIVGFDGEKTIMGDMVATFTTAGGGTPTNNTDLNAYRTQAATDWYRWEIYDTDFHLGGIADWIVNGNVDMIEWTLHKELGSTRVSCGAYNDITWGSHHNLDTAGSQTTLKVGEQDGDPVYLNIDDLRFHQDDCFVVTNTASGQALVRLQADTPVQILEVMCVSKTFTTISAVQVLTDVTITVQTRTILQPSCWVNGSGTTPSECMEVGDTCCGQCNCCPGVTLPNTVCMRICCSGVAEPIDVTMYHISDCVYQSIDEKFTLECVDPDWTLTIDPVGVGCDGDASAALAMVLVDCDPLHLTYDSEEFTINIEEGCVGECPTSACCPAPDDLTATLVDTACPCVSGSDLMTYNAMDDEWTLTIAMGTCGRDLDLTYYCVDGVPTLDVTFSDACSAPLTGIPPNMGWTCSPLSASFTVPVDPGDTPCGCEGGGGLARAFIVTIEA